MASCEEHGRAVVQVRTAPRAGLRATARGSPAGVAPSQCVALCAVG